MHFDNWYVEEHSKNFLDYLLRESGLLIETDEIAQARERFQKVFEQDGSFDYQNPLFS
ncbi:MAG: hypothetical protein LW817_02755 [Candidatus Caenarcaniphilales bacterium]|jgi:hypothetical protein|nr:hypothetical protein [Candidatus Caenarcaniphilales bacterium]